MKKIVYVSFALALLTIFFYSCQHTINNNSSLEDKSNASKHNDDESKNMSGNCLSCHIKGGSGDGVFTLGGTVFKKDLTTKQPNGYIKLYSEPNGNGKLLKTIEVDQLGNFYSDANYNFDFPVYASAVSSSGIQKFMSTRLSSGACASCHGTSTAPVINVE